MLLKILELVGIVAFAASGALVGVSKRFDIFGVCVVGVFTASAAASCATSSSGSIRRRR